MRIFISVLLLLIGLSGSLYSEEYKFEMKGVKASLISEVKSISPGQKFTVAIYLQHFDGFHTYWKNPGMVGFATTLEWNLPVGFKAGEIQWQVPERSKMLKYNCHAYKGDTYLLVDIQAPKEVPEEFRISAKVGGMSCSTKECCKIGYIDVGVDLKKSASAKFDLESKKVISQARKRLPKAIEAYSFRAKSDGEIVQLKVFGKPAIKESDIYFYTDENIADTEVSQLINFDKGSLELSFKLNNYAPKKLTTLKGLLYSESGWGVSKEKYLLINCHLD